MTFKQLFIATAAGLFAAGTGCVSCKRDAFYQSMKAYGETGVPMPLRQKVYLFIINGSDGIGLCSLRDKVCEAGFSKVYIAQRMDANWYEREVRRVAQDDPSARVVLLGTGYAADKLIPLALGAAEDGVNVDALIIIDPAGEAALPNEQCRTLVVRSAHWPVGKSITGTEVMEVEGTGHLAVAASPPVVEAVISQLVASANAVDALTADPLPRTVLSDIPNPIPRDIIFEAGAAPATEWNFLHAPTPIEPLPVPTGTVPGEKRSAPTGDAVAPPKQ